MQTTIIIKDLVVPCYIGILPHEHGVRQDVRFGVEVTLKASGPVTRLTNSVDYSGVVDQIRLAAESHTDLVEELAHSIVKLICESSEVFLCSVTVEKLSAIEGAVVGARVVWP